MSRAAYRNGSTAWAATNRAMNPRPTGQKQAARPGDTGAKKPDEPQGVDQRQKGALAVSIQDKAAAEDNDLGGYL